MKLSRAFWIDSLKSTLISLKNRELHFLHSLLFISNPPADAGGTDSSFTEVPAGFELGFSGCRHYTFELHSLIFPKSLFDSFPYFAASTNPPTFLPSKA